eukprot:s77_g5.t1
MGRAIAAVAWSWLPSASLADWVTISGLPGDVHHADASRLLLAKVEMGLETTEEEEWVPVTARTLWPPGGYNPESIGNMKNAEIVPPNFAARNFAMVAPVSAGSPPQPASLLLDTEGSDIWLPSIRCRECAADQKDHSFSEIEILWQNSWKEQESFYHATDSSTFHPHLVPTPFGLAPRAVGVNEGGGHVGGYVINDTITIGNLEAVGYNQDWHRWCMLAAAACSFAQINGSLASCLW